MSKRLTRRSGSRRVPAGGALLAVPSVALAAGNDPAPASSAFLFTAAVLTITLVGWLALVWWLRAVILDRLKVVALARTRHIQSRRLRRISLLRLNQLAAIATRLGSVALVLGALLAWATALLDLFPDTHDFAQQLEGVAYAEIRTLAVEAVRTLPGLMVVALIYFATRIVHELLNHYFGSIAQGEVPSQLFDAVTAETTRRLVDVGIWVAAVIIAFPYIPGSASPAFRGVTVLAGLMLSLGSANLVGQFASGLSLIYGRAVRPGEYIETGATEGTVEHIGLFACTLRTPRDEIVVLPHTALAAGLKNFSRAAERVRLVTTVSIGYDTPWRQVHDLLLAAAAATPGIRPDPTPVVRQSALDDFYVSYELMFTPEDPAQRSPLLGRVHAAIQDRFHAAGVQIMSPHYLGDPAIPKVPPTHPAN